MYKVINAESILRLECHCKWNHAYEMTDQLAEQTV